jgi:hypothetical protein
MATNPDVICPKCGAAVPFTEALARPFLEVERKKLEKEAQERATTLERRESEIEKKRRTLVEAEKNLKNQQAEVDRVVDERLRAEREALTQEAVKKASSSYAAKLQSTEKELTESKAKLAAAEKAELEARRQRSQLESEKRGLELTISRRVAEESEKIREEVVQEQTQVFQTELKEKERALAEKDAKLLEAQQAELAVRKERRTLEAQKRELELQIERRLDEERGKIREATQKEEDESHRLKLAEKDKVIADMRKQVDELRRKSEQGSQQIQGEVGELELEGVLKGAFPGDHFEPVPNGRAGGDVIQTVVGPNGLMCGKILWENKRAKNWSDEWLRKNRDDQRAASAHLGAIITTTLPKGVSAFDRLEGVWVAGQQCTLPLAKALRQLLIEAAVVKVAAQGRDGKMERMYGYLTGQQFRQRVSGIVEAYVAMHGDLDAEKRATHKHWARRERQLDLLLTSSAGMYGDLQGIVGKSLPELDGLKLPAAETTTMSQSLALTEGSEPQVAEAVTGNK